MIGRALMDIGHYAQALPWCKQDVEHARANPDGGERNLASSLTDLGICHFNLGNFEDACDSFKQAAQLYGGDHRSPCFDAPRLAVILNHIGTCLRNMGRFHEALRRFTRSMKILDEHGGVKLSANKPIIVDNLYQAGLCQIALGDYVKASVMFHQSVRIAERGDGEGPIDYMVLATNEDHIGICLLNQGRPKDALPWFDRAVNSWDKGRKGVFKDLQAKAVSLTHIARCWIEMGAIDKAQNILEEALKLHYMGNVNGRVDHRYLGYYWHLVGWCHYIAHNFEEAQVFFVKSINSKKLGDIHGRIDNNEIGAGFHQMGMCFAKLELFTEAILNFQESIKYRKEGDVNGRVNWSSIGDSWHEIGWCRASLVSYTIAASDFECAVEIRSRGNFLGIVDNQKLGASLHQVGFCLLQLNRAKEALLWYVNAMNTRMKGDVHGEVDFSALARTLHGIACCHMILCDADQAIDWFERALLTARKAEATSIDIHLIARLEADLEHAISCKNDAAVSLNSNDLNGLLRTQFLLEMAS